MKSSVLLTIIFLSLVVGGCSKVKDFEEKTKSMEQTTKEMSGTTNEMKSTTTTMYQQIRSKEAEDTRTKKFEALMDSKNDMGAKFASAAVYFKSFEFQLWNADVKYDDAESRDILFLDATNEFTRRICDIYEDVNTRNMSPTKEGKRYNAEMAFYALAATIHMNHHYQEELVKNKNVKAVSFYDLVKNSLLKDINGQHQEEHEITLMAGMNKEIMIELIKARVDILSALALKDLTDKRNMTLGQKAKALIFKITGGRLGSIDLPETYDKANEATKITIESRLDGALKARNFLREIGINKEMEKTLKSALTYIDFNEKNNSADKVDDKRKEKIHTLVTGLLE